jgi:flagellar basal-body rod protein FlgB
MLLDSGMYGKTNFLLERGLDVSMQRRTVLADNIANVDVPNFKRSDISYEAQLRRAIEEGKSVAENFTPARLTDQRHMSFYKKPDYRAVKPKVFLDYQSSMRNDGNNVDPEVEVTNALKNQMRYQALMTSLNDQFRAMNLVIRTTA